MALYGLSGVRLDEAGRILRARLQQADGATSSWIGSPFECEALQVAKMIVMGDAVYAVFIVLGRTALGPKFRPVVYPSGVEGIELEAETPGRSARDLLLF